MLPADKKENLRIIRNVIWYLQHVDIYGNEAEEVAEAIKYMKTWAKLHQVSESEYGKHLKSKKLKKKKI